MHIGQGRASSMPSERTDSRNTSNLLKTEVPRPAREALFSHGSFLQAGICRRCPSALPAASKEQWPRFCTGKRRMGMFVFKCHACFLKNWHWLTAACHVESEMQVTTPTWQDCLRRESRKAGHAGVVHLLYSCQPKQQQGRDCSG